MSNIPFMDRTRHVQGFAHGRWDDYSDVPDGGLAETDAFNDAISVSVEARAASQAAPASDSSLRKSACTTARRLSNSA